ncbi:DUF2142 domain-containing protein [Anaeromyxobacter diazotrophicus]|uniref:DUF2142 domain-containing protein n=1 Tax=Anaeromyxobacter diazotrophicus TaxID=2590199 RepID=A0A7I9VIZ0_9BACT|nr:DUF2142 domain-containing protein [Anaeromyxobacter diazotrophicus]GEJ56374.1 hypothetical protein AMYX_11150 [Anaeromyxobacter diazotrophicus]
MTSPASHPDKLFLYLALCFGIVFAFVVPPIQFADEDSHYKKAYAVSTGDVLPHAVVDASGAHFGNRLPRSVLEFVDQHRYMIGRPEAKYRYSDLYLRTAAPAGHGDRAFNSHSAAALDPLVYLPSALGMLAGRLLYGAVGASALYTPAANLYFGRLFNLFFFVACVTAAIRLTPIAKTAFAVAALLPMSLALAASVNRDATVIAAAFLFTAFVLHLAHRSEPIRRRDLVGLFALGLVLLLGKQIYFSLMGLLLLVPPGQWGPGRAKWRSIAVLVGACLGLYLLESVYVAALGRGAASPEATAVHQQLAYVLHNPARCLSLMVATPVRSRIGWTVGLIGNLGWLDTNFPYPFLAVPGVALAATTLFDPGGAVGLAPRPKLVALAILLATGLAIELGFYVLWTSLPSEGGVGADTITGIQGRYFLPLLPLAIVLVRNGWTAGWTKAGELVDLLLPPVLTAVQVVTLFILVLRYWIP